MRPDARDNRTAVHAERYQEKLNLRSKGHMEWFGRRLARRDCPFRMRKALAPNVYHVPHRRSSPKLSVLSLSCLYTCQKRK